jgi:hypothetical protein
MARTKQNTDARRDLAKETAAAAALKEQLKTILAEEDQELDEQTLQDTIEGETNLLELMKRIVIQIDDDDTRVLGIKKSIERKQARKSRLENRIDFMRTMLVSALEVLGQDKFELDIATISRRFVQPKLVVTDEAMVPASFFKVPEPALSRADLTTALRARSKAIDDLESRVKKGELEEGTPAYSAALQAIVAANPPIPGAELGNGSFSVAIRFI